MFAAGRTQTIGPFTQLLTRQVARRKIPNAYVQPSQTNFNAKCSLDLVLSLSVTELGSETPKKVGR